MTDSIMPDFGLKEEATVSPGHSDPFLRSPQRYANLSIFVVLLNQITVTFPHIKSLSGIFTDHCPAHRFIHKGDFKLLIEKRIANIIADKGQSYRLAQPRVSD